MPHLKMDSPMDTGLEMLLHDLRSKRCRLAEARTARYCELRRFIRENLCVFLRMLSAEPRCLSESDARADVFFVFSDRLQRAAAHCREMTHTLFRCAMVPAEAGVPQGARRLCAGERASAKTLDSMLKMVYAIEALRKSTESSAGGGTRSLRLAINIVSMTCRFLNGRDELCSLGPVDLAWPYSGSYASVFGSDFHVPFGIEGMAGFVVGQKVGLLVQDIRSVTDLGVDCLEMLLSYSFARNHGDDDVLREGETEGVDVEAHAEAFVAVLRGVIGAPGLSERQKALVFSYVVMRYRGMAGHVDTGYFRTRPTYYYVYWIDHLRGGRTPDAARSAAGTAHYQ